MPTKSPFSSITAGGAFAEQDQAARRHQDLMKNVLSPASAVSEAARGITRLNDELARALSPTRELMSAFHSSTAGLKVGELLAASHGIAQFHAEMNSAMTALATALGNEKRFVVPISAIQEFEALGRTVADSLHQVASAINFDAFGNGNLGISSRVLAQAMAAHALHDEENFGALSGQGGSVLLQGIQCIEMESSSERTEEAFHLALKRLISVFAIRLRGAQSVFEAQALNNIFALLALILTYHVWTDGKADQQQTLDALNSIAVQLTELNSTVEELPTHGAIAVTSRGVVVRSAPRSSSKMIDRLGPREPVELVEMQNGWAHIKFYDALSDAFVHGWVYRKFLRIDGPKADGTQRVRD